MKREFLLLAGVILLGLAATPSSAQLSLDDIEATVGGLSDEMARVDVLLAEPDQNKRLAAMEMLIKSGNPLYAQRARETGLFSSDKEMQRVALKAIFDAGGPFRIEVPVQGLNEDETRVRRWVLDNQGSLFDGDTKGQFLIYTSAYDEAEKCWKFKGKSYCAFVQSGDHYVLRDWGNFEGTVRLSTNGLLVGEGAPYGRKTVKFQIDLVE